MNVVVIRRTVKPVIFKGKMDPKKLKKYAKDPELFVMYNTYFITERFYENAASHLKCPEWDECYRVKPLKAVYDRAVENGGEDGEHVWSVCYNIDEGHTIVFRIKEVCDGKLR